MDETKPVKVAGDLSRSRMEKVDENGGITYHENLVASLVSFLVSDSRGNRVTNWSEPKLAPH